MNKLASFEQFSNKRARESKAIIREEQEAKRTDSANTFKTLLSDYGVAAVQELTEEQRTEFFAKLRGKEVNESISLVTEATRSQIGKIDKSGKIKSVYVHSDGYPEYMAPVIKKGYSNKRDLDQLLDLGKNGISILNVKIGDKQDFNNPVKGTTLFYGRDRNETGDMESTGSANNIKMYLRDVSNKADAEYVYLYDERDGKWYMADAYEDSELKPMFNESKVNERKISLSDFYEKNIDKHRSEKSFITAATKIGFKESDVKSLLGDIEQGGDTYAALSDKIFNESVVNEDSKINYVTITNDLFHADSNWWVKNKIKVSDSISKALDGCKTKHVVINIDKIHESVMNEAEVKSDEEFKEYAFTVLKKAFGEEFDEAKAQEVVDGILGKCDGDYGACVGMLTSSLGESVVTESKEAEEAESILNDLLDERGGDMEELHGMSMEDALDTVEAYGHSGSKAKKIAQELVSICNESRVTEALTARKPNEVETVEVDMAYEDEDLKDVKAIWKQFNLKVKDLKGGQGTEHEVTGKKKDILAYLQSEYYEMDAETIEEFYPELLEGKAKVTEALTARKPNDVETVEVDMAYEDEDLKDVKAIWKQFNLKVKDLKGGQGEHEVTGKKKDILAYLQSEFYEMDAETIEEYYPELL